MPDRFTTQPEFLRLGIGFVYLGGILSSTLASSTSAPAGGIWVIIMINNTVNAAMDSLWDALSLQRSAMMTTGESEMFVLAMILEGGGGPVAAGCEACLATGHGGVIF